MIFTAFILSTLACASAQTSTPATSGSRNPAFSGSRSPAFTGSNKPATGGSPAAAPASSGGSGSCAARLGAACTFSDSSCCNVFNFNVFLPPSFSTEVTCSVAKAQYNSAQSSSWTDAQCTTVKNDIELSGGLNCNCAAPPTPAPERYVSVHHVLDPILCLVQSVWALLHVLSYSHYVLSLSWKRALVFCAKTLRLSHLVILLPRKMVAALT